MSNFSEFDDCRLKRGGVPLDGPARSPTYAAEMSPGLVDLALQLPPPHHGEHACGAAAGSLSHCPAAEHDAVQSASGKCGASFFVSAETYETVFKSHDVFGKTQIK